MTISTTESTAIFNGNGVTTVFPFSFPFIQDSDLKVYQEVVATGVVTEITTGFTKVGAGSNSGGSTATHTIVYGHHLRHISHLDFFAREPCYRTTQC